MSVYSWIRNGQHILTVRNRTNGFAKQHRCWNEDVIFNVLAQQPENSDVYITKYPKDRLVETIILDFDSENLDDAYADVSRMRNYLQYNGHNCIIVRSGSKGYHLYIEIAPFLFKNTDIRKIENWGSFFNAFVCFLIHDDVTSSYDTLDKVNFSAGLNGNIRLIGSVHPKTGDKCEIIEGEFKGNQTPTEIQDEAQRKAYHKLLIQEEDRQRIIKATKVDAGSDPIANNDLREIFRQIVGEIKFYPKGYCYCKCPEHGDSHPSLLVTKEWFSCSANCGFKGNVYTLKKLGYVKFDDDGKVVL